MPLNRYRRFINLPEPVAGGGVVTEPGPVAPAQKISQADAVRRRRNFSKSWAWKVRSPRSAAGVLVAESSMINSGAIV